MLTQVCFRQSFSAGGYYSLGIERRLSVTRLSVTRLSILALACLAFALMGCGESTSSLRVNLPGNSVSCHVGETVNACVQRLPSSGATAGTVIFSAGTYPSGYSGTDRITTANLTLQGAAMPAYNSDLTALIGGTIITGTLSVGADNFTARDLGVDVGAKVAGSTAIDGFVMANSGQVVGQAPFKNPILENVAVLGVNVPGAHTILIENVTGAYVHKIRCRYQTHCFAFKGDGVIDTVDAAGGSV